MLVVRSSLLMKCFFIFLKTSDPIESIHLRRGFERVVALFVISFLAAGSIRAQAPLPDAWAFRELLPGNQTAYSPDGQYLAVGAPGAIQVYYAATLVPFRGINTNVLTLASMIFSPDGKTILVAGNHSDGTGWVEMWNVSSGKLTSAFQTDKAGVYTANFSPDGKTIAVAGTDGKNVLLDTYKVSNHTLVTAFVTKLTAINSVIFTPDGNTLAVGGSNGTQGATELWKPQTNQLATTLISEAPSVTQVITSPDGKSLAIGGTLSKTYGAKIELFNLSTNTQVVSYPSTAQVFVGMAFTPDNQSLISTGATYVQNMFGGNWWTQYESWSVPNLTLNQSQMEGYSSLCSAMSPDGTTIATSGEGYIYANLGVGYIEVPRFMVGFYGFLETTNVSSLSLEKQTRTGSTGSGGAFQSPGPAFAPIVFSPRGTTLLGGGLNAWSGTASIWESVTGECLGSVPNPNQNFGSAFAYAPDGNSYAAAYNGTIQIFRSKDNSQLLSFAATGPTISSMKYSPDGTMIAFGGLNANSQGFVDVRSVKTGSLISTMNTTATTGVNEVDFSPDGKTLVSGGKLSSTTGTSGIVELWNVASGSLISTLNTRCSSVNSTKFSPNGRLIAVGGNIISTSNIGQIEIWDATKKSLTCTLPVAFNTFTISSVVFTPNSGHLLAASNVGIQEFTLSTRALNGYIGDPATYVTLSRDGTKIAYETGYDGIVSGPYSIPPTHQIASLKLNPSIITHGVTTTATVTLAAPAPKNGVWISLYSSNPSSFPVPSPVFVPAGQRSVSTILMTVSAYGPSYVVTAVNGASVKSATLTVQSATVGLLTFSPDTIIGGSSTTGTVTIDEPAGPNGVVVSLSSSYSYFIVPASVTIPAGKQTATFTATSTAVTSVGEVVVSASWNNSSVSAYVIVKPGT